MLPPPRPTLFPYTTLFRSAVPVDRLEGRHSEDALLQVGGEERGLHVVAAEAPHRLGQVVGAEGEELCRLGDLARSEEHTSELQSLRHLVCRLLLEKKKKRK